jgi:hypothetical protein
LYLNYGKGWTLEGITGHQDVARNLNATRSSRLLVVMHESSLSQWGDISAIVAGAIAAVAFVFGIGKWLWNRARGTALAYGIHVVPSPVMHIALPPGTNQMGLAPSVQIGSTKDFPLHWTVKVFTIHVKNTDGEDILLSPYPGPPHSEELPGRQVVEFGRGEVIMVDGVQVILVKVNYRITYGEIGKRPRRVITGDYTFTATPPPPQQLSQEVQTQISVRFGKVLPNQDRPLSRRHARRAQGPIRFTTELDERNSRR